MSDVRTSGPVTREAVEAFAKSLKMRQAEFRLRKRARIWKPTRTSATQLGYSCERRIVYQRALPWQAAPISEELASIFAEGEMHEEQALRELELDLGVRLVNRQTGFEDPQLDIKGVLDAEADVPGLGRIPVEVKGLQSVPGDDVTDDALATAEKSLHRRYYVQLQLYLFLRGLPFGILLVKSKATGRWQPIVVELDFERTEEILQRAERVRDAFRAYVKAFEQVRSFNQDGPQGDSEEERELWRRAMAAAESALPARLPDRSECSTCPWAHVCQPAEAEVDPLLVAHDTELAAQLDRRAQLDPGRREFAKLDETIKERFKLTRGDRFVAGNWLIVKKKHGQGTRLDIKPLALAGAQTTGSD